MGLFHRRKQNLDQRGFTVVELVVSFALAMIVIVFLFQVLIQVKELYVSGVIKTELLTKQTNITKTISDDLSNKKILYATNCGEYCLNFTFEDNTTKQLKVDKTNKVIRYGNYATKLADGSKIGEMHVTTETPMTSPTAAMMGNNSFIRIDIPVTHHLFTGDNFGIRLVYQYNNQETALNNIVFEGNGQTEHLYLRGLEEMVLYNTIAYQEPGWFVIDENGNKIENDSRVRTNCSVGNTVGETYTCEYSFYNNGTLVNKRTRRVTVVPAETDYQYTGQEQVFIPPVNGTYKVELWGAQGGGSYGGNGAYTSGTINLTPSETLYVYVGEHKARGDVAVAFNGGGSSMLENSHPDDINRYNSGGGATDVRLVGGSWSNLNGLQSRIMVAAGGGGGYELAASETTGGAGGTLTGIDGKVIGASDVTVAKGGTQTAGGTGGSGSYAKGDSGAFGRGGNGGSKYLSGGGGGYYGGGASGVATDTAATGAGGSSFISGYTGCNAIDKDGNHTGKPQHYSGKVFSNGKMVAGTGSMPSYKGGTMPGNSGHGYARFTLLSIVSSN